MHEAWSDNATTIRALVAAALRAFDTPKFADGRMWAGELQFFGAESFPPLMQYTLAEARVIEAKLNELIVAAKGDEYLLAERTLIAIGMPSQEAHQRFSFVALPRLEPQRSDDAASRP